MSSPFCDEKTIELQQIFVEGSVRILYPRTPVTAPSALIIPIRCEPHFYNLTEEEMVDIYKAAAKLKIAFEKIYNTTGYNFIVNDGEIAGQHIPHAHFHLYGRMIDEVESPLAILGDKEKYKNRPRISDEERTKRIDRINECIISLSTK